MQPSLRSRVARVLVVTFAVLASAYSASVASSPGASAHSDLESTVPGDGEVITKPVTEIRFIFDSAVEPFVEGFTLRTFDGVDLPVASVTKADDVTIVAVPAKPIRQVVTAHWAIVSGDTHPITGTIVVAVNLPPPPTTTTAAPATSVSPSTTSAAPSSTPAPTTTHVTGSHDGGHEDYMADQLSSSDVDAAEQAAILAEHSEHSSSHDDVDLVRSLLRWITYAATAMLIAAAAFGLSSARRKTPISDPPVLLLAGAVVALCVATLLMIGAQLAALTGEIADVFAIGDWGDVMVGRFRTGTVVRMVAVAVFAVALFRTRWREAAAVLGAALLLISYPILGHLSDKGPEWIGAPSLVVHVATISIWVGGLCLLLIGLRRTEGDRRTLVGQFSQLAGIALVVAALTGVVMAIISLDSVSDLWDTAYGQRLLIKVALVAAVGLIGAVHRFVTIPRMQPEEEGTSLRSFARLGWIETVLFAAVLGVTAWLVLAG